MRDHIRREAGAMAPGSWVVPIVFALAAMAAVATVDPYAAAPVPAPQVLAPTVALPALAQPAAAPAEVVHEVSEHVQAF